MRRIFITGIGTDVGKTVVSAVLTEALRADYWKPVQAGELSETDSHKVRTLVNNRVSVFHPEAYRLSEAMSPHAAAKIDGIEIDFERINMPETANHLIIEGAGGLMVPLSSGFLVMDLIQKFNPEVIVVIKNYLGSINHSLLALDALKRSGTPVLGVVFNGVANDESEKFILHYSGVKCLGRIPFTENLTPDFVSSQARNFQAI